LAKPLFCLANPSRFITSFVLVVPYQCWVAIEKNPKKKEKSKKRKNLLPVIKPQGGLSTT
jgi:hypothetical protein